MLFHGVIKGPGYSVNFVIIWDRELFMEVLIWQYSLPTNYGPRYDETGESNMVFSSRT